MIYISGKITAPTKEEYQKNIQRFFEVEKLLDEPCYNPARNDQNHPEWTYEEHLVEDLCTIWLELPRMYFMKGWEESRGARIEMELAKRLGLEIEYE